VIAVWRAILAVGVGIGAGALGMLGWCTEDAFTRAMMIAGSCQCVLVSWWLLSQRITIPKPITLTIHDERARLELLGGLAAGLAHELGQPLSVARVGIEGVHFLRQLGREPRPEHLARTLSRVGLSLMTMTQTIEHLLSLARNDPGVGPVAIVDVGAAVDGLLVEREQWLRFADTRIEWHRPPSPVMAVADAAGLRLILTNLLRNAVEAVASQSEARRLVRVTVGPGPVVVVHDGGSGMSPEVLARMFDPFVSTKGVGRGIGLSLAKASAERMGARLEATSTLGAGTAFSLTLLAPPTASPSHGAQA